MVTVKFIRSDGKEFYIDDKTLRITKLDGFGSLENTITTEDNATLDGSNYVSEKIGEKDRTIEFVIRDRSLNNSMRDIARSFFIPKYNFECHVNYNGIQKWCRGRLYQPNIPTGNIYGFITISIVLLCNEPYMFSEDNFNKDIAGISGGIEFPLELVEEGIEFDTFEFANKVTITNDGDFETYCKAFMTFSGEVVNPKLILGDYFVRLLDTMQSGDKLEIDLTVKPLSIKKNDENIIRLVDRMSNFDQIKFEVGESTIGYGADSGDNNMSVNIQYYKRYQGL